MNKYQDIMGTINYYLFLIIVALLPFPQILLRYACVTWLVFWIFEGRWLSRPRSLKDNKIAIPFLLFGVWFAWQFLSVFWSAEIKTWSTRMEHYLTFALVVPVGIWGLNSKYNWRTVGKVLIASCIIAVPCYMIFMYVLYTHPQIVSNHGWDNEIIAYSDWWKYLSENISVFKHRLFLCSVELFGATLAIQTYRKRPLILLPTLAIMLSTIFLTGSRQSIITLVALIAVEIIYSLPKAYRLRYGIGVLLIGIMLSIGMLSMHPRMENFDITNITEMHNVSPEHDVRFNIWGLALQQPSDYFWHGLGAGQSTQYMIDKYNVHGISLYAEKQYNVHNQYLEELIEIGIFGLIFFIVAWLTIPLCTNNKGRRTAMLFTTLFMLNMLTDCMFGRFCGIALWIIGLLTIMIQSQDKNAESDLEF